jgi:large repetitive protein
LTRTAVILTITAPPADPISLGNITACETGTLQTLDASSTITAVSGVAFEYYTSAKGTTTTTPTLTSTTAATKTVYVEATNTSTGCKSKKREVVVLTIIKAPRVVASVSNTTICLGDSVYFSGSGASNYNWDNGVIDNVVFTPSSTGSVIYTVVGTDSNGCQNSDTINVNVKTVVPVTVFNNSPICVGDIATFTLTGEPRNIVSYNINGGSTNTIIIEDSGTTQIEYPNATSPSN